MASLDFIVYVLIPAACLATLLGGWLVVRFLQGRASTMRYLSGLAAGYLVASTIVRVIPESLHFGGDQMAFWILGGFLVVHVIEHGITPHFHYGEESHDHFGTRMTGIMALAGLSMHSFLDGMSIMAAMRAEFALGLLVFIGVLLHRVPEGGTISSIFLVRGFGTKGALYASGALAATALLGAFCQGALKIPLGPVLAISAGLGLYVACADLLPQAQKERGWKSTASLLMGILLFMAANSILPHEHDHQHGHDRLFEKYDDKMEHSAFPLFIRSDAHRFGCAFRSAPRLVEVRLTHRSERVCASTIASAFHRAARFTLSVSCACAWIRETSAWVSSITTDKMVP